MTNDDELDNDNEFSYEVMLISDTPYHAQEWTNTSEEQ